MTSSDSERFLCLIAFLAAIILFLASSLEALAPLVGLLAGFALAGLASENKKVSHEQHNAL